MARSDANRKRSGSLRTQMFNKHLYDKFKRKAPQSFELEEISENPGSDPETQENDDANVREIEVEDEYEREIDSNHGPNFLTRILDILLDRTRNLKSKGGRRIPVTLDRGSELFLKATSKKSGSLLDERTNSPYVNNSITSSRYTLYSFLPKQLYAQFSKLANVYFFVVAILQMVPGWSTTGTFTTIIPLCVFMGISMLREAYDDLRRHKLDKQENRKTTNILSMEIKDDTNSNISKPDVNKQRDTLGSSSKNGLSSNPYFHNFEQLRNRGISVVSKMWKDVNVGDFVLLKQDEWVPADMILITSDGEHNECYVETMALDGETNLKTKFPPPELNKLAKYASGLADVKAEITTEDPNNDLYNFEGNVEFPGLSAKVTKYPLNLDNIIYRGSIIRNTEHMIGLVVFTGEETKVRMNAIKNPRTKAPKLQKKINSIVAFMVLVVASVSLFSYMAHVLRNRKYLNGNEAWYLLQVDAGPAPTIMSFIIMYNTMIPLSLYVTMELIKVMQSKLMEWDIDMYHSETDTPCEARTATILEELGQVSYIFSDKTGTLTNNKMMFRKFSFCGTSWYHDVDADCGLNPSSSENIDVTGQDLDIISMDNNSLLNKFGLSPKTSEISFKRNEDQTVGRLSVEYKGNSSATYTGRPSMRSLYGTHTERTNEQFDDMALKNTGSKIKTTYDLIRYIQLHPDTIFSKKARFFILSIALCHSCLPRKAEGTDKEGDAIEYQSSSPDEIALITAARDLGYILIDRDSSSIFLKTYPNDFNHAPVTEAYEILDSIEFNSQRKRMSVLVRFPDIKDKVLLICKGADNVILDRLKNNDIAYDKFEEIHMASRERKDDEAELVLKHRMSIEKSYKDEERERNSLRDALAGKPRASFSLNAVRKSLSRSNYKPRDAESQLNSVNQILESVKGPDTELDAVIDKSRKSLHKQQLDKYGPRILTEPNILNGELKHSDADKDELEMLEYIGRDDLITNEEYVIERTLQYIEEYSTEGLRTLLYAYKWIDESEYRYWNEDYNAAKTSLSEKQKKIDEVGEAIEQGMLLLGATAIEDKLQEGVGDAINKIRRAGIKMWILTGDKRETAINIGYSCNLIHDYSTVVVLSTDSDNIVSKMNALFQELKSGNVAHCVVVIDGATLTTFEGNPTFMSVFIELCTKTDSVICCRASPSQKALLVSNIRATDRSLVTLAIGDGANDIAMIQSADIGIGITGKEGLQASRSADYSIGQFRFLLKLLLVHGRYNYVRTVKFILCTFYKEVTFYLTQLIFQRYTMFSGTSLYESWSLSMFNTLFTSLPVLVVGMFEKDLKPATLLTVPELYSLGRLSQGFNMWIFLEWVLNATFSAILITLLNVVVWGQSSLSDNTLYPLGFVNFTSIIALVNVKAQFVEMRNRNWIVFASVIISCGGWLVWCCALPGVNKTNELYDVKYGLFYHFGKDITFWCTCLVLTFLPVTFDIVVKTIRVSLWPTDSDIFAVLERRTDIRKKLEIGAYSEMKQGWTWKQDKNVLRDYMDKVLPNSSSPHVLSKRRPSDVSDLNISFDVASQHSSTPSDRAMRQKFKFSKQNLSEHEILPSGKVIPKKATVVQETESIGKYTNKLTKKLRLTNVETEEDIQQIINQRMKDLE